MPEARFLGEQVQQSGEIIVGYSCLKSCFKESGQKICRVAFLT